ncbi:MAG: hypothetical protein MZU84_08075 [Sphingobacterium sp.]|nr:hypothetical protein [Sphingobacterium sp.]
MSKNNRAVPSVRTSRLTAIIAVSTILAISTVGPGLQARSRPIPGPLSTLLRPHPDESSRIRAARRQESRHPNPRRRRPCRLRHLRRQELSRRRNRPLGNARSRRPCRRLERLGLLDDRLERRDGRGHLRHRMRLARARLLVHSSRASPLLRSHPSSSRRTRSSATRSPTSSITSRASARPGSGTRPTAP